MPPTRYERRAERREERGEERGERRGAICNCGRSFICFQKAQEFFTNCTLEEKQVTKKLFKEVGESLGLVGYNMVSRAKEVYRIRRGERQPWPMYLLFLLLPSLFPSFSPLIAPFLSLSQYSLFFDIKREHQVFKDSVLQAFTILEEVVNTCFGIMVTNMNLLPSSILSSCGDTSPLPPESFSSSPFDLFHYFNQQQHNNDNNKYDHATKITKKKKDSISKLETNQNGGNNTTSKDEVMPPNCYEHVDPGMLTCVPCATTPGLEIVDRRDGEWLCIEKYHDFFLYFFYYSVSSFFDSVSASSLILFMQD